MPKALWPLFAALGAVALSACSSSAAEGTDSGGSAESVSRSTSASGKSGALPDTFRTFATGLTSCDDGDSLSSRSTGKGYLTSLMQFIMSKNPETFQGQLAPEGFCLVVADQTDVNGHADPFSGQLMIARAAVEQAENDAEVAGLLAHELSHVTMRHGVWEKENGIDDPFVRIHPKLRTDATWLAAKAAGDQAAMDAEAAHVLSPEELANWPEAEADSIGLILFLRAGFPLSAYAWPQVVDLKGGKSVDTPEADPSDFEPCMRLIDQGTEPPRGRDNHPDECWRLFQARVTGRASVAASPESKLLDNTAISVDVDPSLAAAQAEATADPLAPPADSGGSGGNVTSAPDDGPDSSDPK